MKPISVEEVINGDQDETDLDVFVQYVNRELSLHQYVLAAGKTVVIWHHTMSRDVAHQIQNMYSDVGWAVVFSNDYKTSTWWMRGDKQIRERH